MFIWISTYDSIVHMLCITLEYHYMNTPSKHVHLSCIPYLWPHFMNTSNRDVTLGTPQTPRPPVLFKSTSLFTSPVSVSPNPMSPRSDTCRESAFHNSRCPRLTSPHVPHEAASCLAFIHVTARSRAWPEYSINPYSALLDKTHVLNELNYISKG